MSYHINVLYLNLLLGEIISHHVRELKIGLFVFSLDYNQLAHVVFSSETLVTETKKKEVRGRKEIKN